MGTVSTIKVTRKRDGLDCVINESDFDPAVYAKPGETKPPVSKKAPTPTSGSDASPNQDDLSAAVDADKAKATAGVKDFREVVSAGGTKGPTKKAVLAFVDKHGVPVDTELRKDDLFAAVKAFIDPIAEALGL